MKSAKRKYNLIAIVGPTASGKSELAVFLAKKLNGEIISADSRQVYKHLDIGSNKVPGTWRSPQSPAIAKKRAAFVYKNIPHYCIDCINPKKNFTVVEYKKCARRAIKDITSRGKVAILVGGAGFYVQAVIDDIAIPEVEPNWRLRRKLEKKAPAELFRMLKKLDPRRAGTIDQKNSRRLIRAIEIVKETGKPVPRINIKAPQRTRSRTLRNTMCIIGLRRSEKELKKRITKQVKRMLKNGLIGEVKKLQRMGLSKKRIHELGFEYSHIMNLLQEKSSTWRPGRQVPKELEATLIKENWRYAKRQIAWWRNEKRIIWLSPKKVLSFIRGS